MQILYSIWQNISKVDHASETSLEGQIAASQILRYHLNGIATSTDTGDTGCIFCQ